MTFRQWCALYRPEWAMSEESPTIPSAAIRPDRRGSLAEKQAWMRQRQIKPKKKPKRIANALPPITAAPGANHHPNSLIVQLAEQLRAKGVL